MRSWKIVDALDNTLGFPRTTSPSLALVMATLTRRGSSRNPTPWFSFDRTQLSTMKSFSRPWNASTLATSTRAYSCGLSAPWRWKCAVTKLLWPSYGVTTPTRSGATPARRKSVTIFSTLAASPRFR